MRKLSSLLAIALFALISTTTFAQEEKEVKDQDQAKIMLQDKTEVQISELPEAVTKTLNETYADYTAKKAYKATKDDHEVYYVKLQKEGAYKKVLIDAEGNVIEEHDIKDLQSKLG